MISNFKGKTAVLTGAASGFGLECARIGAKLGMKLVMVDVQQDALDRAAAEMTATGAQVMAIQVDVSDAAQMAHLARRTQPRGTRTARGRRDGLHGRFPRRGCLRGLVDGPSRGSTALRRAEAPRARHCAIFETIVGTRSRKQRAIRIGGSCRAHERESVATIAFTESSCVRQSEVGDVAKQRWVGVVGDVRVEKIAQRCGRGDALMLVGNCRRHDAALRGTSPCCAASC